VNGLVRDVRYALRAFARAPGFTAVAVATLALGIGANTAIFSVVDAVMIRPVPGLREPGKLVWITNRQKGRQQPLSYPDYLDQRRQAGVFAGVLAFDRKAVHAATGGEAERVEAEIVSPEFFTVLGVLPVEGRLFLPDDERETRPVAVLSHAYWQRRFGGRRDAVGSLLTINARPYTVVGVAPPGFSGLDLERFPDLYVPLPAFLQASPRRSPDRRDSAWLYVMGRLAPGVSLARADREVARVARGASEERAADLRALTAGVEPMRGWLPPGHSGDILPLAAVGLAATGLVLLIAAANVAGLLVGRAVGRRREIAVRIALGASRGRIAGQLLTESVVLALAGAAAGLVLSFWTLDVLLSRFQAPAGIRPALDAAVLGYSLAVAVGTGLLFGLAPAWRASRRSLAPSLRDSDAGHGVSRSRLQGALAVTQMALSLVLLAAAGLFLRSLQKAATVEVGLDRRAAGSVLAVAFDLETQGYSADARRVFERTLAERVASLPGVEASSFAEVLPLAGLAIGEAIAPEGSESVSGEAGMTFLNTVSPGYFSTLGIPLVAGRDFSESDRPGAAPAVIVNEVAARRFWPGQNPLGRRLHVGSSRELLEVVGVARGGKYVSLTERPRAFVYLPLLQRGAMFGTTVLLVRSTSGAAMLGIVRELVRSLDPRLPVFDARTLAESLDRQLADRRQGTFIVGILGALAVLLAAVGLYGVLAYAVSQRTREIGVRMALGAGRSDVLRQFLGQGARLAAAGLGAGLLLSAALTRLLSSLIFGVTPMDAATFAAVSIFLVAVALVASYLPARRAASISPMEALRNE
jgi:predicted permease